MKGTKNKTQPSMMLSFFSSTNLAVKFFFGGGGGGRGGELSGVARHVGIAFNFTKHHKRFTSPLGLYLSELSEGSTLIKRQALRFWFPPENSR